MDQNREDPRERLNRMFPRWLQPGITWLSGKALPGQAALLGLSCTPKGKILVAFLTVGLGMMIGAQFMSTIVA